MVTQPATKRSSDELIAEAEELCRGIHGSAEMCVAAWQDVSCVGQNIMVRTYISESINNILEVGRDVRYVGIGQGPYTI